MRAENPITRLSPEGTVSAMMEQPLCVDMDGTLVKSDTLVDSLLLLVRSNPLSIFRIPGWILRGRARLKREVTSRVSLDVGHLPYNREVLAYLHEQQEAGRRIFLATGADSALAERVAAHLKIFDGVLASDGSTNLIGDRKRESLRAQFGEKGYDYIGNANADIPLLKDANVAMIANPAPMLRARLRSGDVTPAIVFLDRPRAVRTFIKAIRVHQWAKNVLILVPLILAHALRLQALASAMLAFFCFSLCASATYLINDLLDIEADRKHPRKRSRPFAAGNLSAQAGVGICFLFLAVGLAGAGFFLPQAFLVWLLIYLVATLAYSFYLKRVVLVDVILLSGLYTLRVLAGGAATQVPISPWLSAFSVFLFLSLAMVKRFSELKNALGRGTTVAHGRGYRADDIEQLRSFGTASAYASIVVFALYISGRDATALYRHPNWMWLMTPMMLLWLSRIWLLASRGELNEDPVIFAVTDRMSLFIGAIIALITILAAF
jgi:4-hydroxybenzoate polyprenyltransferase